MTAICMTAVSYNNSAAITILPKLISEFDMRPTTGQWVLMIYTIAVASLVPIFGRLGDILHKVHVFIFGIASFAAGSLLVVISPDSVVLLIGRLLQGIGAGTMFGNSLGILSAATPENKRAFVFGLWGGMISLGLSLGPVIGGLLAEYISWRAIFVLDLVLLAAAAAIAGYVVRRAYVPHARPAMARFDYLGGLLMILLLGPLTYALSIGGSVGWTNAQTLISFAIAAASGIGLFFIELGLKHPLIRVHYLLHPRILMAMLGMAICGYVLFNFFFYFNTFIQSPDTLNMSPVIAGLAILPYTFVMFVFSVTVPGILAPYSYRWPVTIGMICMAAGFLLLANTTNMTNYSALWWKLLILGVGFGLTFPLLPRLGLRLVHQQDSGQASGVINNFLFMGATIGVVVGGIASAHAVRSQLSDVITALPVGSYDREALVGLITYGSFLEIEQILSSLESTTRQSIRAALAKVHDDAFSAAVLTAAVVSAIGAVLAVWLLRGPVPEPHAAVKLLPPER